MVLAMIGLFCYTAGAQSTRINTCGVKQGKVCRPSKGNKTASCYKTEYAENFKVCKNEFGYFICCEVPGLYNSTYYNFAVKTANVDEESQEQNPAVQYDYMHFSPVAPQNQSYINTVYGIYDENYSRKNGKKACYVGNNVAENNRAPYKACPSPQSDGPEANRQRNLNVSNPVNTPPLTGRSTE